MKYFQYIIVGIYISIILSGCATTEKAVRHNSSVIELREASDTLLEGYAQMVIEGSDKTIYVDEKVVSLTGDVQSLKSGFDPNGMSQILVTLTEAGKDKLSVTTKMLIGKLMAFLINGKVVMVATVRDQLDTDRFVIVGDMTIEEMDKIVSEFNQSE